MSQDKFSLDQIRDSTEFDLLKTYEINSDDSIDSPFNEMSTSKYYYPDQFREMLSQLTNTSSYFHLNCRGLSNNCDSFRKLLLELHTKQFSFDFIGIS